MPNPIPNITDGMEYAGGPTYESLQDDAFLDAYIAERSAKSPELANLGDQMVMIRRKIGNKLGERQQTMMRIADIISMIPPGFADRDDAEWSATQSLRQYVNEIDADIAKLRTRLDEQRSIARRYITEAR